MRLSAILLFLMAALSVAAQSIGNVTINGKEVPPGQSDLTIPRAPISLEFNTRPYDPGNKKFYAVSIAATKDISDLQYFVDGEIGRQNPFFSPGTGIAGYPDKPYECLYVRNSGQHYVYYEDENTGRAELVEEYDSGIVRLRWDFKCLVFNEEHVKIKKSELEDFYMMIFIDDNLNDIIEEGEYSVVTIIFE